VARTKAKFDIVTRPERCVGCRLCQMRCSFRFTKSFSFTAAHVEVSYNERQQIHQIRFDGQCDSCGLCARACTYGAIALL